MVLKQQPCSEHQQDQGVDYRRSRRTEHAPLLIHGEAVERVNNIKFLGIHITSDLTWSMNTAHLVKKAQQRLFFLRKLKRAGLSPQLLTNFYRATRESILCFSATVCIIATSPSKLPDPFRTLETEVQHLLSCTGDQGHVEALKSKKAAIDNLLGITAQGALVRSCFTNSSMLDSPAKFFFSLESRNGQRKVIHCLRSDNGSSLTEATEIRRDYEVLSKALALRLREVMAEVVHVDQTYCVPGR
ncbi:hypothetical protein L3Q82_005097 [Scortum barcoo]|uniref:Uncharacterized protein n=1 Tax=Scortum barcoo TaxID=214431 RepID=A0ACB8VEK3_9TELE|nr:hypothetical protein L3Q82_005097 [Scortum barcoo]